MSALEKIEKLNRKSTKMCIFGCGTVARKVTYPFLKRIGIQVDFFVDNVIPEGTEITDGLLVKNAQHIFDNSDDIFVFIGVSAKYQEEIKQQLMANGIKSDRFLCVDWRYTVQFAKELDQLPEDTKKKYPEICDDKTYLENLFCDLVGYKPDIDSPKTFNEKLQWLKLNDRKTIYSAMVDKYAVKEYVANKIPDIGIINSLGVWKKYDDIDFAFFPEQFVLKCTHDSGSVLVVNDKKGFDPAIYRESFNTALSRNYYYSYREWPYKNVQPRIMAEEYKEVPGKKSLPVYKFFCFNGKPRIIQAIENDKHKDEVIDYYDTNWQLLDLRQNFPNSPNGMTRPLNLEKMLEYAEILSEGHPFIRVDFYEIDNKVYFSEFTFFSDAGFASFSPEKWDLILGQYINLPIDN